MDSTRRFENRSLYTISPKHHVSCSIHASSNSIEQVDRGINMAHTHIRPALERQSQATIDANQHQNLSEKDIYRKSESRRGNEHHRAEYEVHKRNGNGRGWSDSQCQSSSERNFLGSATTTTERGHEPRYAQISMRHSNLTPRQTTVQHRSETRALPTEPAAVG